MLVIIPKKMSPYSTNSLLDPKILISDTGETNDTTPHKIVFVNLKDAK